MKRLLTTLWLVLAVVGFTLAQRTVMGTVKGDDGEPLIGATVLIKGTTGGARTDVSGKYSVSVPAGSDVLVFSYTGYATQEITLGASNVVDVVLAGGLELQETVVTALGVSRYKNELPYSAQKVQGDDVANVRNQNVVNSLSGKVAGLQISRNNSIGGSTNVILRGTKSLTGNNQALFVVDGIPFSNDLTNDANSRTGRGGYDYGNAAADINPDDIESVTVLKGAAATALYGSRASNGVVMITTKQGSKKKGLGITANLGMNFGTIDKSTFPKFQTKYGGGYGQYYEDPSGFFLYRDVNGDGQDDLVMPTSEDASWGGKFDPNLMVYQWDAFDPSSPNYQKARPWVAAANGPETFFETAIGTSNSVMIDGASDKGYFKLGFTRNTDKGYLPNSNVDKNIINFGAGFDVTDKLKFFSSVNYTSTDGKGRYGTGYESRNQMTSFRQWWQMNVDIQEQREAYERTRQNVTWNWADPTDLVPIYWDNVYWTRFENFQTDSRNRYFGYAGLSYDLAPWLNILGRVSLDQYDEIQEERFAVGSIDPSQYQRYNRNYRELNYDLMATIPQRNITDAIKFDALLGTNIRKTDVSSIRASTNGGLVVPRLYSLANTLNTLAPPTETYTRLQVNGVFAKVGFVYNNWAILDLTGRRDQASSLPLDANAYFYPSASLGLILSEFMNDNGFISFAKARVNYAEVGNTAPPLSILDVYNLGTAFDDATIASVATTKNNETLEPERTSSWEAGLELRFARDRFGVDVTVYKQNTRQQILPATVSRATGYNSVFINAGDVENKGVEVQFFARPVVTRDFNWRIGVNWGLNRNKVLDLNGIDNLQLGTAQGGFSVNAALGEPYGTIRGTNFTYLNGQKVVNAAGYYQNSPTSNEIIGNVNPDWIGGITNSLTFKNITLGFLVDVKKGGDVFSLDLYYGLATGLYEETAGLNDLGNEVRASLADGGGLILPGVKADGTPNDIRYDATNFGIYGYRRNPAAGFVYDAGFVKLREVNLTWDIPSRILGDGRIFKGIALGVYGRNLWIIHKNLPHADPEEGYGAGNFQGHQGGAYPTARTIGFNLNLKF
ncbi:MAG: SusC/RagA family TonB-linked outer membrane protein [Saprospiraceae bacterium]